MIDFQEKDIEHIISIIAQGDPKPILLLGAGASVKSGIPATGPFVERAAAWNYSKRKQLSFDDVRIRRSDWMPFLESQSWFNPDKSLSENYPNVFKYLLSPREIRREFYRIILDPKIPPSIGYTALTELVAKKYFNTILTTNFDSILYNSFSGDERIHFVDVVKSVSDYSKISTAPKNVQIIHLHGDVDNYTDKNDIDEIQDLNGDFIQRILPLLSDHPLIVVGYRGYENSIMQELFIKNANYTTDYKHGIYWCILENDNLKNVPENLKILRTTIGNNLQIIKIKDFDNFFNIDVLKGIKEPTYQISYTKSEGGSDRIFDLRADFASSLNDLDIVLLKQRMIQYCKTLHISAPEKNWPEDFLHEILKERDLIIAKNGILFPTNSGLILFGTAPTEYMPYAAIKVEIKDDENYFENNFVNKNEELQKEYIVEGNLWAQLNTIIDIVSQFNKPFKLKGEETKTVTPYSPLAIKELLTNCIVHRNYEDKIQTVIEITPKYIRILNSGGLIEDVQDKLSGEEIEDVIRKGNRGIKGYRNPVLADLFYGTETMEKRGSGLPDVFDEAIKNGSQVKFGPDSENRNFEAIIYARPEVIDEVTNTAKRDREYIEKFSSNITEIISFPEFVYIADCIVSPLEIKEGINYEYDPPYVLRENKIIAFFDISNERFGFTSFIDLGTVERFLIEEYFDNPENERRFIELLNLSFMCHLKYLGLRIDTEKKRAFFERDSQNEDNIQIKYQARVKTATRTVVKKRVSSTTGKIIYWEHKSFSFRIEKFGKNFGVIIIPNYSFTYDGFSKYIKVEKINILSTKRASRDYNMNYLNDLNFWLWIITNGGKQYLSLIYFPESLGDLISNSQKIILSNEYIKATTLSEDIFDDLTNFDIDDIDEVYDDVDRIALSNEDNNDNTTENIEE